MILLDRVKNVTTRKSFLGHAIDPLTCIYYVGVMIQGLFQMSRKHDNL